jgi:predicted acetyltransferase
VNPVSVDDAEPWLAAAVTTLLGSPWDDDFPLRVERWKREWLADRTWGVRDGGRWVATLATDPRTVTVPGVPGQTVEVEADGVTVATVAATHRRRGLLTRMISSALEQAVERGDAVSMLIAAEWPIYGRFGYAPASRYADYTLRTRQAGASIAPDPAGTLRQVEPSELAEYASDVFQRSRRFWAGQVDRGGSWWSRRLAVEGWPRISGSQATWILHESDGEPDGFVAWKVVRDFELSGEYGVVEVGEFAAATPRAYRNLWSYLASLDVIGEVRLRGRPVDEPVRWLLGDGRALVQQYSGDDLWLRLLDIPAALSARGYATAGQVVLEVVDDSVGGYAAGRYLLDAGPDGASCSRTDRASELRLPQRVLASAYLGDRSVRELAVAGGVDELAPRALARFDAMLATPTRPWNATGF